jgi:transposase
MTADKYVAFDVHDASTFAVVRDARGDWLSEAVLTTKPDAISDFLRGLSGRVALTFEEGTHAAWLYDLTTPLVSSVLVCNPRENRQGPKRNKTDRIDATRLSDWLFQGRLKPVFHDHAPVRRLKHTARVYAQLVEDSARLKNRLKALFRSRALPCAGQRLYAPRTRAARLTELPDDGTRFRAELVGRAIDALAPLIADAKRALRLEAKKHPAYALVSSVPGFGPVRSSVVIATVVYPHRFRRDRQLWAYAGLSVVTHSSSDYLVTPEGPRRRTKAVRTRGLTSDFNRPLKAALKGAAMAASRTEPFKSRYDRLVGRGLKPEVAQVVIARKLASCLLAAWKKGERFDPQKLTHETR